MQAQTTSVFISAHPDDWQLFMNPNAYQSVKTDNEKVIFLHTTAGDGGNGVGSNFYLARQEGSLRAIRFMSNTFTNEGALGANMNQTTVMVNGHAILKFSYRNAVAYFLRLPDGNLNGDGFPITGNKSLQKLYNGSISSIAAIDGSATYISLADLKTTIQTIIQNEANPGTVEFNMADIDINQNPYDHSDHIYSAYILNDVANNFSNPALNYYVDYYSASRPANILGDDLLVNSGTWGVTASGISDLNSYSTWDYAHNIWLSRQYFRSVNPSNLPIATIVITDDTAAENPFNFGKFNVRLNSLNSGSKLKVNFNVTGTATEGVDYEGLSRKAKIKTSTDNINIKLNPIDDTEVEDIETVTITLTSGTGYTIGSPSAATLSINSDDVALLESSEVNTNLDKGKSNTIILPTPENKFLDVSLYPNPNKVGTSIKLDLNSDKNEEASLQVYDFMGSQIINETVSITQGNNSLELPPNLFKTGIYIIKITLGNDTFTQKVVVE